MEKIIWKGRGDGEDDTDIGYGIYNYLFEKISAI